MPVITIDELRGSVFNNQDWRLIAEQCGAAVSQLISLGANDPKHALHDVYRSFMKSQCLGFLAANWEECKRAEKEQEVRTLSIFDSCHYNRFVTYTRWLDEHLGIEIVDSKH